MTRRGFAISLLPGMASAWQGGGDAIRLFNGVNLDGFDTFLKTQGLNHDPGKVFQVHDGMLHVSGAEYGYVITKQEYWNYRLKAEFKWGDATHPPRAGQARDSGILFHVTGPNQVWPESVEFQMIEGGTGDIIGVGDARLTVKGAYGRRFDRFGKSPILDRSTYVAGYRDPKMEYEKPHGEWNVLELVADGDTIRYIVNGKVANEGTGANRTRGKMLFQSEGAEVYFRNIELQPLR